MNFAANTLEIAVPPDNPAGVASVEDLSKPGLKLVLCAPAVPGGDCRTDRVGDGRRLKPVSEEQSVTDVLNKVSTGEGDAGLVYVTDVKSAGAKVKGITFPESGGGQTPTDRRLGPSKSPELAKQFVALVTGPDGQQVLGDAGFARP